MIYPKLDECLVRGQENDYYLQSYKSGEEYHIDNFHAKILWLCNGGESVKSIAKKLNLDERELKKFLDYYEGAGLIEYKNYSLKDKFPEFSMSPCLEEVQIEATGKCNLHCKHCYGKEAFIRSSEKSMNLRELESALDQMREANVGKCFLSGGEIFTRKDLPDIIGLISDRKIHISGIFTNGTIFRQEVIDALGQCGIFTHFLVSIDSHIQEIHDYIRGSGSFEKTISFIREARTRGIKVTVNTVAMKPSVNSLFPMKKFLTELGVSLWRISVPREQGEVIANKHLIEPSWPEIFALYRQLLLHKLERPGGMKLQLSSIFRSDFLDDKRYYLYNENNACCQYKRWSLVMTADGNLIPCPAGFNVVFGNIKEDSLLDVWHSERTQVFKTLPVKATECLECGIKEYCGAGCRISAKYLHGSYLAKDENACPLYGFFKENIQPILAEHNIFAKKLKGESCDYDYKIINQLFA
ncbi:radical SAM protein [Candidatus Falkowbacteria bacterium]|nr:radical SAM protein [Candidatus Falkowbacteria bacterium]